jgi:glutamine amidotransferase
MITYVPAHVDIPWEGITNGAYSNDDGHGWAVASHEGGLQVGHSLAFDEAAAGFELAREDHGPGSLAMFHSRYGTHGTMDETNVHPFYVDDLTVVAHNGILPSQFHPRKGDSRSDTRVYIDRELRGWPYPGVPSRRRGKAIGRQIGLGNKLVFLSVAEGTPKVRIVNAHLGTHSQGVWFSNDGFIPWRNWQGWQDHWSPVGGAACGTSITGGIWDDAAEEAPDPFWADCSVCGAFQSVDADTSICDICESCADCKCDYVSCLCYRGSHFTDPRWDRGYHTG